MPYIHPDECVDCGACEPVCPVEAIYYEDDVPEQWAQYTQINADFFDELGSPGGASKVGWSPTIRRRSRSFRRRAKALELTDDTAVTRRLAGEPFERPGKCRRRYRSSRGTPLPNHPRWPARTLTGSSTCRSARRSILLRHRSARRWPPPAPRPATRRRPARRRCGRRPLAALPRRYGVTGLRGAAGCPRSARRNSSPGCRHCWDWAPTICRGTGTGVSH